MIQSRAAKAFFLLTISSICVIFYFQRSFTARKGLPRIRRIIPDWYRNLTLGDGEIFHYRQFKEMDSKYNNNTVVTGDCFTGRKTKGDNKRGKIMLVTNFLYFKLEKYRKKLFFAGGKLTDEVLNARIMEVLGVFQDNLKHPSIQQVHVLVHDVEAVNYLRRIKFENSERLVITPTNESVSMKTQLLYAAMCLKDKIVAISHQDNAFGKGWDKLKPQILRKKKIMYALTRHTSLWPNSKCKATKASASCDRGMRYIGSHDTFVFYVRNGFTAKKLAAIDNVTPNLYGMENLFIWLFQKKLGYKVLNPCPILFVHHHHCVSVRDSGRKRVDSKNTKGTAPFTYKLQ